MHVVADEMTRNLLTVEPGLSLVDAAKRMNDRGVGAVIVTEGDRLVGILTERDMLHAVARGFGEDAKVREWMTAHPETIDSSDSTEHAAALMIHGGFRHLPVLEEGRLAGILSIRDVMRVALQDMSPRGV